MGQFKRKSQILVVSSYADVILDLLCVSQPTHMERIIIRE